ncbi:hypothetical protein PSECIP111951_00918 [Pseudoalteromonas holothuriae]|uniref:Uncharacterized protein n=1 Tax=Pseudoalteromonas holothuriae TaxID=2963714 RepID=A0A9W4QW22_9GAMM|nr:MULTISPECIES: hypothetical protein [unclassified Pseudoalteromonas]CAH9053907.1 hypothetical protein PSECIP111951_00918 [Pseudoalteromonas sp. CIP111951]CAH9055709.1 hypothetical protein PSECIP111854_01632 [Pseudoalteromonas sp. CIP111854]
MYQQRLKQREHTNNFAIQRFVPPERAAEEVIPKGTVIYHGTTVETGVAFQKKPAVIVDKKGYPDRFHTTIDYRSALEWASQQVKAKALENQEEASDSDENIAFPERVSVLVFALNEQARAVNSAKKGTKTDLDCVIWPGVEFGYEWMWTQTGAQKLEFKESYEHAITMGAAYDKKEGEAYLERVLKS